MLIQCHREYRKSEEFGCFAVGKSEKEIFKDLKDYCEQHPDHTVFYYEHPVRPGKEIPVPEYMLEIEAYPKTIKRDWNIVVFWTQVQ